VPYYDELLKCEVVQDKLSALDPDTDLNDSDMRLVMAVLMAEAAPDHIKDFLDDTFLDVYSELL
jgi:hypothetical protein